MVGAISAVNLHLALLSTRGWLSRKYRWAEKKVGSYENKKKVRKSARNWKKRWNRVERRSYLWPISRNEIACEMINNWWFKNSYFRGWTRLVNPTMDEMKKCFFIWTLFVKYFLPFFLCDMMPYLRHEFLFWSRRY